MEKKKQAIYEKWWFWVLIFLIVVVISGSSNTSTSETVSSTDNTTNITVSDNEKSSNSYDIEISAKKLIKAYEENEIKAKNTYKDKKAKITGTVNNIGEDILSEVYITINNGEKFSTNSVQCYFENKEEINKVAELKQGDKITVIGTIDEFSIFNVSVKDCTIADEKE